MKSLNKLIILVGGCVIATISCIKASDELVTVKVLDANIVADTLLEARYMKERISETSWVISSVSLKGNGTSLNAGEGRVELPDGSKGIVSLDSVTGILELMNKSKYELEDQNIFNFFMCALIGNLAKMLAEKKQELGN